MKTYLVAAICFLACAGDKPQNCPAFDIPVAPAPPSTGPQQSYSVALDDETEVVIELDEDRRIESVSQMRYGPYLRFKNGVLQSADGTGPHGKTEGMHTSFWDDGTILAQEPHRGGRKQGIARYWHATGDLESVGRYENGERVAEWLEYFPSGELKRRTTYIKRKSTERQQPPHENPVLDPRFKVGRVERRCRVNDKMLPVVVDGKLLPGQSWDCPATSK